jgi:hypothetical protein
MRSTWSGTGSAVEAATRDATYGQFLDAALLRLRACLSADGLSYYASQEYPVYDLHVRIEN